MSNPAPATTRTSGLARLKLTEPVRLYLYSVGAVVLLGLVLGGVLTEDWRDYGLAALGIVLAVPVGTEAARASVYSPATAMRELVAATTIGRNAA